MRGEHGLDFLHIPARVALPSVRPLLDAPLYLLKEIFMFSFY